MTDELPVLFKKKALGTQMGAEESIMEEVRRAYLGSAKVSTANLTLGQKLRELRESFVSELMVQMRAFPGHLYQPLCVIIDTLYDASLFRESNANGFHYKVIGGCHNFTAAVRLSELDPSEEVFKTRICSIYGNDLSEEAVLWLANRHNKVGEYRHHMSLTEKIQLCRYMFESVGKDRENRNWHVTISTILGDGHSKGVLKLLCKLAEMEDDTFNLLQRMLVLFGEGKLKGQKLSQDDLAKGPQMKPYILVELPALPSVAAQKLLTLLIKREITLQQFQKEAKILQKLQTVQRMFLDLMGLSDWEEATRRFPDHTREVLEHFACLSLRKTPVELKTFCNRLRNSRKDTKPGFQGKIGSVGSIISCDALSLNEDIMSEQVPQFSGVELTILDKPKDWGAADVKTFLNVVTSLNLNRQLEVFNVVVLCEPADMSMFQRAIGETQHFQEPMMAFYAVPCGKQSKFVHEHSYFALVWLDA
ncbi:hypothetical protein HOLleu_42827 [Holothuria leucospilota]|uniref:Uncharacterized protein n=1 Tax=Holothuria leucospilota TaxID=206669 RepID=A0A9Q0YF39_HOLLE|nr:hypothetical protein HOLleu_42827 [Holothuria leucospilota]